MKKRAGKILMLTGGCILLLALALFITIGSSPVLNFAVNMARQQLASMDMQLEVGEISGNPLRMLEVKRLSLSKDNVEILSLPQASFSINIWALVRGDIAIENLVLHKPVINVNQTALSLGQDGVSGEQDGASSEQSGGSLQIYAFSVNQATINFDMPVYQAYSLSQLQLNGAFAMAGDSYKLELAQAHALWQLNGQPALNASGGLTFAASGLGFNHFTLELGDNRLQADGALNWGAQPAANMRLQARFSQTLLPGGSLEVAAPPRPFDIDLKLDGTGQNWDTALTLAQEPGSLSLHGTVFAQEWRLNLSGQARKFYPRYLYAALPEALAGINLNGPIALQLGSQSLTLALNGISLDDADFGLLQADIAWNDDRLEIKQLQLKQPDGSLNLNASLPLPFLSAPGEAELRLDNFILPGHELIAGDMAQGLQGSALSGQASLQGSMQEGAFSLLLDKIRTPNSPQAAHLYLAGNWRENMLSLTKGELQAPWGSASLAGRAGQENIEMNLEFHLLDINPIFAFVPPPNPYIPTHGRLRGQVKASGRPQALRLDYAVTGQNLKAPELAVESMELKGDITLGGEQPAIHGQLNTSLLDVAGLSFNSLLVNAQLNGNAGNINLQALSAAGWKAGLDITPLDFTAWQLRNINFNGPRGAHWQQQGLARLDLPDNGVSLQNLQLQNNEQSLTASFSLRDGVLQGEVNINQADLGAITGSLPANPRLSLRASLGGRSDNPELTFSGQLTASQNQEQISLNLHGGYSNQQAALSGQLLAGGHALFDINGTARIANGIERIQLSARADKMQLKMLQPFVPQLTHLRGTLDMDINIAGTWPRVSTRGYIQLENSGFSVNAIAMHFRRFNMLLECNDQGLNISKFELRTGPGEMRASGSIGWPWQEQAALNVNLNAKDLSIKLPPWGRLGMDADLSLSGGYATPVLTGNIINNSANLQLFRTSHSDLDEVVAMNSDQTPPPLSFDEPEVFNIELPAFLDSWRIMASMAMAPNFRVTFPQGWFQVSGKVELDKEPWQEPVYSGRYTIDGGVIVVFGTRIESLGGSAAFTDPASIVPELDLRATVRKGFTSIVARVHGSAANPVLSLTSDPPMPEADILSMLAFGKPIQELNREQGSSLSSQAMALAVIGEQARQELQNLVGAGLAPDVITVHNEMQQGSFIEAGKYITSNLYLRYRQNTDRTDSRNLGLEWQLTPRVSLQGQVGTERDSGVDIIFHFVFYETEEQADFVSEQAE